MRAGDVMEQVVTELVAAIEAGRRRVGDAVA